jgi:signal transduction histidine kinase/PAS domain-containing protein
MMVLCAALAPAMIVQAFLHVQRFRTEQARELESHADVARAVAVAFHANIEDLAQEAHTLGQAVLRFAPADWDASNQFLSAACATNPAVTEFAWLSPKGWVIASSDRGAVGAYRGAEDFFADLNRERRWVLSVLQPDRHTGDASFTIAHRVEDGEGQLRGIVTATVSAERFADVRLKIHRSAEAGFTLFDHKGFAAFHRPYFPFQQWRSRDFSKEEFVSAALNGREAGGKLRLAVGGKDWFTVRTPVPDLRWVAGAGRDSKVVMAPLWRDLTMGLGFSALGLLISAGVAVRYGRMLLTDLNRLHESVTAWGRAEWTGGAEPVRSIAELRDVAEAFENVVLQKERMELSLRENEKDLSRAQAVAHTGSWRLNVTRNELLWSDENHRIFGIPQGLSLSYESFLAIVHPDDREYVNRKWTAALRGEPYDIEHRIIVGDSVKWVRERAELELDKDGMLLGGFGTTQDITRQKQTEEALRQSESRFKLLSETAGRLLESEDPQGSVNELCLRVMEHLDCQIFFNFLVADESADMLHLNAYAGIPEKETRRIERIKFGTAVCGCVAREKKPIIVDDILNKPDHRTELVKSYGIQAYACHPLMAQGRLIGTLSFGTKTRTGFSLQDLALMKTVADQVAVAMDRISLIGRLQSSKDDLEMRVQERTAALSKMNEEQKIYMTMLEQSNRELEDFVHVASHDLQEPLRKIQTFADRLANMPQESLNDRARDYLDRMNRAAGRMQALVLDLLRYAHLTSKPEPFTPFNLKDPIEEAVLDLGVLCEEVKGSIECDALPDLEADRVQMRQLFQNLIANGLKYRSDRKPLVRIYDNSPPNGLFWKIHVEDNGIGFDECYLDKVFRPFQRLHGKDSPYQGTGMGLAICRKIVERHGGSITARSKPGEGATFIVELPKKHYRKEAIH